MGRRDGASFLAEMARQERYERRWPRYYGGIAHMFSGLDDKMLRICRNVFWLFAWGWFLIVTIPASAAGFAFAFVSGSLSDLVGVSALAVASCGLVCFTVMLPADEIRRRDLAWYRSESLDRMENR